MIWKSSKSLSADRPRNQLLNWIAFGNGAKLEKVEIEIDGQRVEIADPQHYTPSYPWTCTIILTIKDKDGNLMEYKASNLTIKPIDYQSIEINNIKPVDILPVIGQVEQWDKECYNHIEHLRLAEATRIRDMMRNYGAGNHSKQEYQQLMNRLNTVMYNEIPEWYNNYEFLLQESWSNEWPISPSDHAHQERFILDELMNHTKLKVFVTMWKDSGEELLNNLSNTVNSNDNIYILWVSMESNWDKNSIPPYYLRHEKLTKLKRLILFCAWGNIREIEWERRTKTYQANKDINNPDAIHWFSSIANWENDEILDKHVMVTIGTNKDGNVDISDLAPELSRFPVWFHPKVLFSWRMFPLSYKLNGSYHITWLSGQWLWKWYPTSPVNYVNVAMTSICFQMFAEAKDADELLEMIRSTCLTDYIHLDWETQELQLINPAWFFQKYLMPNNLPKSVKAAGTASLSKGYYKGVIFDIPGAEVKIEGKWIAYNDQNKKIIKAQNPMNLEWRINGDLCKKMGYDSSQPITGSIIVVDDQWNGLNMTKDFSITLTP